MSPQPFREERPGNLVLPKRNPSRLYPSDDASATSSVRFSIASKPSPRTKTIFRLAHPPPTNKSKKRLRIRPRLLLQLHQLSEQSRAFPALDVLPSTIFAPRLANRFPKVFKGKNGLGTNDLVIVSSDSYDQRSRGTLEDGGSSSEDETWEGREVVATICQLPKEDGGHWGKAEICLNHGSTWTATPLINGSYEFVACVNGSEVKARWVLRSRQSHRTSSMSAADSYQPEEKRFTFSIIDPNTRRHPVIASMTNKGMDILDKYSSGAPGAPSSSTSSPTTPSFPSASSTSYFDTLDNEISDQALIETDEHLRSLIVLTGIWIVFREGWSKIFGYTDAMSMSPLHSHLLGGAGSRMPSRTRTMPSLASSKSPDAISPASSTPVGSSSPRRISGHFSRRATGPSKPDSTGLTESTIGSMKRAQSVGAAYIEKQNRRSASAAKRVSLTKTIEEDNQVSDGSDQEHSRPTVPSRNPSRLHRRCTGRNDKGEEATDPMATEKRNRRISGNNEKTISTASTLFGCGDAPPKETDKVSGATKEQDFSKTAGPQTGAGREEPSNGKPAKKPYKRWSIRHIAHTVSCR